MLVNNLDSTVSMSNIEKLLSLAMEFEKQSELSYLDSMLTNSNI